MEFNDLTMIGLSESEANIYLTLLKLGESTVVQISQSSGLHRTNIYDSIEKLKAKGLVSYLHKENKQFFRAADPENLLLYLKEKENSISKIIPELKQLKSKIQEKITVEVFKGPEGMKSSLRDILEKKQEVVGYSIAGQLRRYLPRFSEYYFREQKKFQIKHRFIYTKGVNEPPTRFYEIKYLPKDYASLTISLCYDNIILNLIWEPEMVAIRIISKELAQDYKKHFSLLWKIAK